MGTLCVCCDWVERGSHRMSASQLLPSAVPLQVTTNWKDLDDLAGSRASGLEGVGATAGSFGGARKGP